MMIVNCLPPTCCVAGGSWVNRAFTLQADIRRAYAVDWYSRGVGIRLEY